MPVTLPTTQRTTNQRKPKQTTDQAKKEQKENKNQPKKQTNDRKYKNMGDELHKTQVDVPC